MRKIDPVRFQVATQGTSREINRQIVLNLVRANQPISRADLARTMGVRRGSVSLLVSDLLQSGLIVEGASRQDGSRPQAHVPLHRLATPHRRRRRRAREPDLSDAGRPAGQAAQRRRRISDGSRPEGCWRRRSASGFARCSPTTAALRACEGVGVAIPGHDRALDDARAARADARVAQRRCARPAHRRRLACRSISRTRAGPARSRSSGRCTAGRRSSAGDFVFVSVSDGLGIGVIVRGELLRGRHNVAGEFGHVPLTMDGPRCSCGAIGLLGGLRVEPRDAGPVFWTCRGVGRPGCRRRAGVHRRGSDFARAPGRRESPRRDSGDRAATSAPAWCRSSTCSIRRGSTSAARLPPRGTSWRMTCAPRLPSAR